MSTEVKETSMLHRALVCLVLSSIIVQPALAQTAPAVDKTAEDDPAGQAVAGTGLIRGRVFMTDDKTPLEGAIVHAYHLGSQKVFASAPSDAKGRYELGSLPFGYADLFVETPDGVFVANQVVSVPPAAKLSLTFVLFTNEDKTKEWWTGREPKQIAVLDKPATGIAEIQEDLGTKSFWTSPGGIAIMAGGGALALLAISASGNNNTEPEASPFMP